VYEDGKKTVTLKGDRIAEEFQALVSEYVTRRFGRASSPHPQRLQEPLH
jgi:(E)-4-hydroxy-3-methylbut-2-enyl-diphosphate synthase